MKAGCFKDDQHEVWKGSGMLNDEQQFWKDNWTCRGRTARMITGLGGRNNRLENTPGCGMMYSRWSKMFGCGGMSGMFGEV